MALRRFKRGYESHFGSNKRDNNRKTSQSTNQLLPVDPHWLSSLLAEEVRLHRSRPSPCHPQSRSIRFLQGSGQTARTKMLAVYVRTFILVPQVQQNKARCSGGFWRSSVKRGGSSKAIALLISSKVIHMATAQGKSCSKLWFVMYFVSVMFLHSFVKTTWHEANWWALMKEAFSAFCTDLKERIKLNQISVLFMVVVLYTQTSFELKKRERKWYTKAVVSKTAHCNNNTTEICDKKEKGGWWLQTNPREGWVLG